MADLARYRAKRDFDATPEPSGARGRKGAAVRPEGVFVIQKHAARRLHYDFRLEMDGVLKSWAVTRGPSLVPGEKRLAVHVEDHPLAYGGFEGTIPKGQYGGGNVIIWDRGTWTPIGDPHAAYAKGHMEFTLDGEKLHGRWHLVRMAPRGGEKKESWLLIKAEDAFAHPADAPDILAEAPASVVSGRTVEELSPDDPAPRNGARKNTSRKGTARKGTPKTPARAATARTTAPKRSAPTPLDLPKTDKAAPLREDEPAADVVRETHAGTKASDQPAKRRVRLTHPDRVYWPDVGLTKEGLADYYAEIWRHMAPFVTGRPLALVRCPEGIDGQRFFQKHPWKGLDKNILQVPDPKAKDEAPDEAPYLAIRDLDGLTALVQGAALEIHPFGATVADWERPDILIMDLDPGEDVPWRDVLAAAREVRERLENKGLSAFVKTSGGKGLHVCAPLAPQAGWAALKAFTKGMADEMAADSPERFVATIAKSKRKGRILVDYLRNQRGATAVAPYSTRARPGAPVSMPLAWEELGEAIGPQHFTAANAPARLACLSYDPWEDFRAAAVPLPKG